MLEKISKTMDKRITMLAINHRWAAHLLMFFIAPAVVLISVFTSVCAIMLPISFIFGWI